MTTSDKTLIKEALLQALEQNEVAFIGEVGKRITRDEMISLIENGDPAAENFIEDVVAAVVRTLHLRSKKSGKGVPKGVCPHCGGTPVRRLSNSPY